MKLGILRLISVCLSLTISIALASAQEVSSEEVTDIEASSEVTTEVNETELTSESQPAQLYALAQNVDDSELLRMYNSSKIQTPDQLLAKAKKVRKNGWIIGGICAAGGIIAGIIVHETTKDYHSWSMVNGVSTPSGEYGDPDNLTTGLCIGGGIIAGAAVAVGCNVYANSLQKRAYSMQTYTTPIIENDIMNFGANKLTAGVSVMGNQYTHTRGLGMSVKLSF